MEIIPTHDIAVLELSSSKENEVLENNIVYVKQNLPTYRIVRLGSTIDNSRFNVNDIVICNSTPEKINLGSKIYYVIKFENIAGKIEN